MVETATDSTAQPITFPCTTEIQLSLKFKVEQKEYFNYLHQAENIQLIADIMDVLIEDGWETIETINGLTKDEIRKKMQAQP